MKRQIIRLTLVTLLFYVIGRLAYEHFYRLTISIVKSFSTVPINFFGKFDFWFFGDSNFGLIIASIPLTVFVTNKLSLYSKKSLIKTSVIYALHFVTTYLLICWLTSLSLLASNDYYKYGQELVYNLRQIKLNKIFLTTVFISTTLTALTLLTIKISLKFKTNNKDNQTTKINVGQNAST